MAASGPPRRTTRQLRFRITASYLLFFTCVYVVVGVAFRQVLERNQETQNRQLLDEQWAALRGYLRFGPTGPVWLSNENKPEEASIIHRLRQVFFLADSDGTALETSPDYRLIGPEQVDEIRRVLSSNEAVWRVRRDTRGTPFLIRSGVLSDRQGRLYYASTGRSLIVTDTVLKRFTWNYLASLPLIVLTGALLGWWLTSRTLGPLNDVVRAARRISGSNLNLRIPPRGTGDELDDLIETFNDMLDRLERSFQHIKQFSTDVSHELRTPVTAIRGQLEVALFTAQTAGQYREAIQNALEETERLSGLVKAMLLLSRAESGQLALKKQRVDLAVITREVVDQFSVAAEEARLRLVVDAVDGCFAEVDVIQFERLLSNLLTNAFKYTPAGGEVRASLSRRNAGVELVVEDTGRGIPPEHVPHIFDRFYRVPTAEGAAEKGMGLGLNFVAWIAKAHGGRVNVESAPGRGSRFIVMLPAVEGAAAGHPPDEVRSTPAPGVRS